MSVIETTILRTPWDVDRRLAELCLDRIRLKKVVDVAISASADATPFHPSNAPGTFAYQHGTGSLRREFVGDVWSLDRPGGVETIRNDSAKVMLAYANVDIACNDEQQPRPRSYKGAGAERVCIGNLFGPLPHFVKKSSDGWATYYLMVDETGAAELSRPVIKDGTFSSFIERIYLFNGADPEKLRFSLDEGEAAVFDPVVARK